MSGAMIRSIHGAMVEAKLPTMPCGGTPLFDSDTCFAVLGSIGQPERCKQINKEQPHDT